MSAPVAGLLDRFKPLARQVAQPIVATLVKLGVPANAITAFALLLNVAVAALIVLGQLPIAGGLLLFVNSLDFLDGAVARASGTASEFGAMLDSVADRYSELVVFLGLVIWYGGRGDQFGLALAFAASTGSVMVSYARARAEGLGYSGEVGFAPRPERIILLGIGLIFASWLLTLVLFILAVLTNLTAVQRVRYVWEQARERGVRHEERSPH